MAENNLKNILSEQEFFTGLRDDQLVTLAALASKVEYGKGAVVFEEGGSADSAYVILDGAVALELDVSHRAQHIVQTLHGSEVLGWGWLFPPYRWAFSAVALEPTRLIRFEGARLRAEHDADCELGYEMMKRFAQVMTSRLAATRLQLVDFYGNTH